MPLSYGAMYDRSGVKVFLVLHVYCGIVLCTFNVLYQTSRRPTTYVTAIAEYKT